MKIRGVFLMLLNATVFANYSVRVTLPECPKLNKITSKFGDQTLFGTSTEHPEFENSSCSLSESNTLHLVCVILQTGINILDLKTILDHIGGPCSAFVKQYPRLRVLYFVRFAHFSFCLFNLKRLFLILTEWVVFDRPDEECNSHYVGRIMQFGEYYPLDKIFHWIIFRLSKEARQFRSYKTSSKERLSEALAVTTGQCIGCKLRINQSARSLIHRRSTRREAGCFDQLSEQIIENFNMGK